MLSTVLLLTRFRFSGLVLEKVCEYFYYNEKHKDAKDVPEMDLPTELCLELLMAADYLDGTLCEPAQVQQRIMLTRVQYECR